MSLLTIIWLVVILAYFDTTIDLKEGFIHFKKIDKKIYFNKKKEK